MPTWLQDTTILAVGIVLLLVGGDVLVRGAVALATRLKISPLIVGLTVVAFGTSAPELALNASAALNGNTDLSFGNIVGSNIANIGLILGLSALIKPMAVNTELLKREIPLMLVASIAAITLAYAPPAAGASPGFSRLDGIILLAGFALFLFLMLKSATKKDTLIPPVMETVKPENPAPAWLAFGMLIAGLAMLVLGGALAESGAVGVAKAVGLSEAVIGLTVVAIATSLPELATSLMAARRGQVDIAVGNVVGSNLFNILLVLGTTATIAPTPVPAGGARALIAMLILSLLLIPMSKTKNGFISRLEGAVLLTLYAGILTYEVVNA